MSQPESNGETAPAIEPGMSVLGIPVGQSRRQRLYVTDVSDGVVTGLLVSKKHPGDFRGKVVCFVEDCQIAPPHPAPKCADCQRANRRTPATHYRRYEMPHSAAGVVHEFYKPLCDHCASISKSHQAAPFVPLAEVTIP